MCSAARRVLQKNITRQTRMRSCSRISTSNRISFSARRRHARAKVPGEGVRLRSAGSPDLHVPRRLRIRITCVGTPFKHMVGGPYVHLPSTGVHAGDPDLLFSFAGSVSHPIRCDILAARTRSAPYSAGFHLSFHGGPTDPIALSAAREEQAALLKRSKFVLHAAADLLVPALRSAASGPRPRRRE